MRKNRWLLNAAAAPLLLSPLACPPGPNVVPQGPVPIELQTVASSLVAPNYLTHAGDATGRLFVVDQVGLLRLLEAGQLLAQPFLDIRDRIVPLNAGSDERGLLGLAFHPSFADPASPGFGRLYTYQSEPLGPLADFTVPLPAGTQFDHQNVVTEWRVDANDPNRVDPLSARDILRSDHPRGNHNAGQIVFGPDGFLYIGIGDGGGSNDSGPGHSPQGNGQDTTNILGDILRIDPLPPDLTTADVGPVSANGQYRIPADNPFLGTDSLPEIFAYGFRNPFRFSFDRQTGQLLAGDVGQRAIEEVDVVTSGGNYGWPLKEGTLRFNRQDGSVSSDTAGLPTGLIDPILEYDHQEGLAVIGGFVYRGSAIAALAGQYLFGDLSRSSLLPQGRLFFAQPAAGAQVDELIIGQPARDLGLFLKGFGEDAQGELYVLAGAALGPTGTTGTVLKIVPAAHGPSALAGRYIRLTSATPR